MQGHWTAAFYDAVTGPTEFIISIVNSVKMVNMPQARLPHLELGKQTRYIIIIKFIT